jgi:hypothetical protein
MTKEERGKAIKMVRTAFAIWESDYEAGEDWSEQHKARDAAIQALKKEPCEDTTGKPFEIKELIDVINKQEEWLAHAGYDAYNVCIAFGSIKRALRKCGEG